MLQTRKNMKHIFSRIQKAFRKFVLRNVTMYATTTFFKINWWILGIRQPVTNLFNN